MVAGREREGEADGGTERQAGERDGGCSGKQSRSPFSLSLSLTHSQSVSHTHTHSPLAAPAVPPVRETRMHTNGNPLNRIPRQRLLPPSIGLRSSLSPAPAVERTCLARRSPRDGERLSLSPSLTHEPRAVSLLKRFEFCGDLDCPDWVLEQMQLMSRLSSVKLKVLATEVVRSLLQSDVQVSRSRVKDLVR